VAPKVPPAFKAVTTSFQVDGLESPSISTVIAEEVSEVTVAVAHKALLAVIVTV
jgi:hypothetical protein